MQSEKTISRRGVETFLFGPSFCSTNVERWMFNVEHRTSNVIEPCFGRWRDDNQAAFPDPAARCNGVNGCPWIVASAPSSMTNLAKSPPILIDCDAIDMCGAVRPILSQAAVSAPCSTGTADEYACGIHTPQSSGLMQRSRPILSCATISAPCSTSTSATSTIPDSDASCNGVHL